MKIVPCSRVEWHNDGLFGTPSPTVRTADQELHGYISADLPADVKEAARQCALTGIQAAGIFLVLTNWEAAWPVFKTSFLGCMGDKAQQISAIDLRTETICKW